MSQPAKATTVTMIGAGLGGIALVANFGLLGYRLRLHDRDEARASHQCASAVAWTSTAWPRASHRSSSYTLSLITLLETPDAERLAVAEAYGAHVPVIHQWRALTSGRRRRHRCSTSM